GQAHAAQQIRELKRHVDKIKHQLRETLLELEKVQRLLSDLERQELITDEELERLRTSLRELHR
ncbi:MAG TPA: hypothetical protein VEH27_07665, partial [Methylomirabilota bacterium]|nr:hypothetical protein [Methylomirabilota bacterium]